MRKILAAITTRTSAAVLTLAAFALAFAAAGGPGMHYG